MKRSTLLIIALACHLLACVLFLFANDLGLFLYKQLQGAADTRGYAPGAVTRLALLHVVVANLLMALTPKRALKIGIALLMCGSLAWMLLPHYPLRASFYCGLLLALSLGAMMASSWIGQWHHNSRSPD
ncbi:hypothetical protein ACYCAX_25805 [Pseudomonas sp. MT3]|uniref:hypothetical protein n=1 Tax=Pseudomonas sp. ATCC 13867 TaxID=1294143 RepID=UPI0002C4DC5B|nr:hypothetical protein [Pseudomonas sp. ATCC 13867]AGI22661.1 hypothetical protein H681_03895 [Pseudomonas sp. ATCC 13867]RFQ16949.1 hypothetical protein D0N87_26370 [Pseudomonas sp. ATCC 13867]